MGRGAGDHDEWRREVMEANDDDEWRRRMRWRRIAVVWGSGSDAITVRREGAEDEFAGSGWWQTKG